MGIGLGRGWGKHESAQDVSSGIIRIAHKNEKDLLSLDCRQRRRHKRGHGRADVERKGCARLQHVRRKGVAHTPSLVHRHSMTSVEDAALWVARDGRWLFIEMRSDGEC